MAKVLLDKVTKQYEGAKELTIKETTLEIKDKEFMILVGPSGCGKSTTLRMIAGLEEITSGTIMIGDKIVNDLPPKDRNIAMVFQNYALYPHMDVYNNMAFGLKLRGEPKAIIDEKVKEAAKILGIEDLLARKPKQLSGGQRQRVALGRAIVRNPLVFLFDEPLSNLDAKLRVQMRAEIIKLHKKLETTMIYVTHDQVEAMTMADRICIYNKGYVQQVATPKEVYEHPANKFVAGFIGSPSMNFMDAVIRKKQDGRFFIEIGDISVRVPDAKRAFVESLVDKEVTFGLRPEHIYSKSLSKVKPTADNTITATVDIVEPLGSEVFLYLKTSKLAFQARVDSEVTPDFGEKIELVFDLDKMHIFDKHTEKTIF